MGGILTGPKTLWTAEELAEIERVKVMYEQVLDWIKREIYKDIPFRSGKKSEDPTSNMWAEPLSVFEGRGDVDDEAGKLAQVLKL
jgi:hypothetical protein